MTKHRQRGQRVRKAAGAVCGSVGLLALAWASPALALAPDRAYELVSPPDKSGANTSAYALSSDSSRALTIGGGGYVDTPSQDGVSNSYLALRESGGWLNRPLNLPATVFATPGIRQDSTPDLSEHLLQSGTREESATAGTGFYLRDAAGGLRRASPPIFNLTRPNDPATFLAYVGGSLGFDHILFTTASNRPILSTDAVETSSLQNVYEVYGARGAAPQVRRVDLDNGGNVLGFTCGRTAGGARSLTNVISDDGQTIFFSGRTPTVSGSCLPASRGPIRVFARIAGVTTVEVSASECNRVADPVAVPPVTACTTVPGNAPAASDAQFRGASRDGSVAFVSTNQQLANSDTDTTDDLYEYRKYPPAGQGHLTQVTAAPGQSATPGSGARHLGVLRVSDDGKRVYFVAQGVLTTDAGANGSAATNGANNLYVFERTSTYPAGRIRFVATLNSSGDTGLWGNETANKQVQLGDVAGRFLVFTSNGRLTSDDTDSVGDVYRYDAVSGSLVRVSRGKDGFGTDGNGAFAASIRSPFGSSRWSTPFARAVTEDGAGVVFRTDEALQAEDTNERADVYEWSDGAVDLVSDGVSTTPSSISESISPDGNSILFSSPSRLTADDIDGAQDAYVARRGGGFTIVDPEDPRICVGDGCQPPNPERPPTASPVTGGFVGSGNVLDPGPDEVAPKLSVRGAARVRTSTVKLTVRPSTPGVVRISGSGLRSQRKTLRTTQAQVINVKLSPRAARTWAKRGRVSTVVRMTLLSSRGQEVTKTKKVVFVRKGHATNRGVAAPTAVGATAGGVR